jgi:hypothetical protein
MVHYFLILDYTVSTSYGLDTGEGSLCALTHRIVQRVPM